MHEYIHHFLFEIVVSTKSVEYRFVCLSLAQCSLLEEIQGLVDIEYLERSLPKPSLPKSESVRWENGPVLCSEDYLYIAKELDARSFQPLALTCIILHVERQPA